MVAFILSILLLIVGGLLFARAGDAGRVRLVGGILTVVGATVLVGSMVVVVDAGEVAVQVVFGSVKQDSLGPGIRLVPPYADVYRYSTRVTEHTQTEGNLIEARVKDGLTIRVDCTTLFALDPARAPDVYTHYATNLETLQEKILVPNLRTILRNVISKYSSEEVYSTKREQIAQEILDTLRSSVADKGIVIDNFLVRAIQLPPEVDASIQAKIRAQQEAEAMTYQKQKAEQEAEIRIIQAQGHAKAQEIINATLTPNYLQHEAIDAYKGLAGSPNTTFVILPTSPDAVGMPLILNTAGGNDPAK